MYKWDQQLQIIKDKSSSRLAKKGVKYSQQSLASLLGVTKGKIQAWEKGQRPSADDLERIGRILGISAEWLLFREGPISPDAPRVMPDKITSAATWNACLNDPRPYSVRNDRGNLIGDLLRDQIQSLDMDQDDFFAKAGVSEQEAEEILQSAVEPSWDTLMKMARLGINLQFLAVRQEPDVYPKKEIDRIMKYLRMTEWELAGELAGEIGRSEIVNKIYKLQKNDQAIPHEWRAKLIEKFGLSPSWTKESKLPTHISAQGKQLSQEVTRLKDRLLHQQNEYLHAMNRELRNAGIEEEAIARIRSAVLGHVESAQLCEECGKPVTEIGDAGARRPQP